jgi:hypothetical protein
MDRRENQDLPERRSPPPAVSRNLTTQELEAVIRRAVELQAGTSARTEEGVSEAEVVKIGQELGLEPAAVRRAVAEVRSRPPAERTALGRSMGPAVARAARVLRRPAAATGLMLERYLRESELMVVQRRFPDRTRYVRDSSLAAGFARFARGFTRHQQPLDIQQLDVGVSTLDPESCLLELSVDLGSTRTGIAAGALGGGGGLAAGLAATVWATPVADPFMLLGIPVFAAAWYGMRRIYGGVHRNIQEKLESFLDRVEHNDLT